MNPNEIKFELFESPKGHRQLYYNGFVRDLNTELVQQFQKIKTQYNFEHGNEFECALCRILRKTLPDKYGVCRGFVVDKAGNTAGNDIIIYDQHRFPTMRIKEEGESYETADYIPIEAVYAYIEAKHTVEIEGDGRSSLAHAWKQVSEVRKLCSQREIVGPNYLAPYIDISNPIFQLGLPQGFPSYRNPLFGMIFARHVRLKPGSEILTDSATIQKLTHDLTFPDHGADYYILGLNNTMHPVTKIEGSMRELDSPFYVPGVGEMVSTMSDGLSYGIGFCALLFALDWIHLGTMIWGDVLGDALGVTMIPR